MILEGTLTLPIAALLVILVIVVARSSNIRKINLKEGVIEFYGPKADKKLSIAPVFSLDAVISSDGSVYKLHLLISILRYSNVDITNWALRIEKLVSMVYKQYFHLDQFGNRLPLGKNYLLPRKENESIVVGVEFEPEKEYNAVLFTQTAYNVVLECATTEGTKSQKFSFRVREQNLKALKLVSERAKIEKRPFVISFPILPT